MSQAQLLRAPNLNLEALHVQSLAFDALADYDDDAEPSYTLTEIGFMPERHESDLHRFRVYFQSKFDRSAEKENTPYLVRLRATGYFFTRTELASTMVNASLLANALTIMYGALRGMVMQSTGAAVHGSIILPTILMADVVMRSVETDPAIAALVSDVPTRKSAPKRVASATKPKPRKRKNTPEAR